MLAVFVGCLYSGTSAGCNLTNFLAKLNSAKASLAGGAASAASATETFSGPESRAIKGYWQVVSIFQGTIVDGRFDNWFADHNELFIDQSPPATDNVCNGTWVQSGAREFKLRHMAWVFDSTNTFVIGTIGIRDTVTIDKGEQTFSGTEVNTLYDLNGNVLGVFGPIELQGTRVQVDF
jgi:hypothetical protein